jgi:hypothetical protein
MRKSMLNMLQYAPKEPTGETGLIPDRDRPTTVVFSETQLRVTLANGRTIGLSLENYPVLAQAIAAQRTNVKLTLSGIYWPDLNLDISLLALLSGTESPARRHKPRFCEG